jgi:hypothetical protein
MEKDVLKTPIETEDSSRRPSIISNGANGIEIKGASSRKSTLDDIPIPTEPRQDRERISASTRDHDRVREKEREKENEKSSNSSRRHHESSSSRSVREKDHNRQLDRQKESSQNQKSKSTPTNSVPEKDPHELEREARNRERLLKEAQRIAGLTGMGSRKRSRDEGDELGGRKGRKKGRRGGAVMGDENEEARLARLEAEREGARWG